jgi:hypothetical protein
LERKTVSNIFMPPRKVSLQDRKLIFFRLSVVDRKLFRLCRILGFHDGDYEECSLLGKVAPCCSCKDWRRNVGSSKTNTMPHHRTRHSKYSALCSAIIEFTHLQLIIE